MLPLMMHAVIRLVNTLSHRDYFYIFLNDRDSNRFSDNFVLTNQSTREQVEEFITSSTTQQLMPNLNIAIQLSEAFQLFR